MKNFATSLGEQPKAKHTMLSFSLESLYKVKLREIKKLIGSVSIKILGTVKL